MALIKIRHKLPFWDRIRNPIAILLYIILAEYVSPQPFIQSRFGKLMYVLFLLFTVWSLYIYRQEKNPLAYRRAQRAITAFNERKDRLSDFTKYRIGRIVKLALTLYAMGWLINGMTDRCDSAISCTFRLPILVAENLSDIFGFSIRLAMSMMGIFLMMFIMARQGTYEVLMPGQIKTRFSDIYGQDIAVGLAKEVLQILDDPDTVEAHGGYIPGGLLLWGPPGTGKTMIAEAFAGETGKPFVLVPPDFASAMFVGVPQMKVKLLFRKLRNLSRNYGGVVVFFDEIDALGNRGLGNVQDRPLGMYETRGCDSYGGGDSEQTRQGALADPPRRLLDRVIITGGGGSGALHSILAEMSGLAKPRGFYNRLRKLIGMAPAPAPKYRIVNIAATNQPQVLDEALLRPGRYDRKVKVGYPDRAGRLETFNGYLSKVKHSLTEDQINTLSVNNPQATGAWIKDIVNEGLLAAIRNERTVIAWEDIRESIIRKSMGEVEGRQDYEEDQWRTAVHEAAHAVVAHQYRKSMAIQFASVLRRGQTLGVVSSIPIQERFTQTKSELEASIRVSLASHIAERLWFEEDVSTGPVGDIESATTIAQNMVNKFAMGKNLAVRQSHEPLPPTKEVQSILRELYDDTYAFVNAHKDVVELVAQLLNEEGTIDGERVHELCRRMGL